MIFSLADAARIDPVALGEIAYEVGCLKGTHPEHREEALIADHLTDE